MKIIIAADSFKDCLDAPAVCAAIASGVRRAVPNAKIISVPLTDGGEGALAVLHAALGGKRVQTRISGPLGAAIDAEFLLIPPKKNSAGQVAVIEAATACGLERTPPDQRNPLHTTTRGVGELLRQAVDAGATRILVTLGGSATVDGGMGLAAALGVRLLDRSGRPVSPTGCGLEQLDHIEMPEQVLPEMVQVEAAVDVGNPLLGETGAARVFGPQKGADAETVKCLERGLKQFSQIIQRDVGPFVPQTPGYGAAGGLAAALAVFCGARIRSGIEMVLDTVNFADLLSAADLVITGEGCTDEQTLQGKVCAGVAARCATQKIPCVALSGRIAASRQALRAAGLTAAFSAVPGPLPLTEAIRYAPTNLAETAEAIAALFAASGLRTTARRNGLE